MNYAGGYKNRIFHPAKTAASATITTRLKNPRKLEVLGTTERSVTPGMKGFHIPASDLYAGRDSFYPIHYETARDLVNSRWVYWASNFTES